MCVSLPKHCPRVGSRGGVNQPEADPQVGPQYDGEEGATPVASRSAKPHAPELQASTASGPQYQTQAAALSTSA